MKGTRQARQSDIKLRTSLSPVDRFTPTFRANRKKKNTISKRDIKLGGFFNRKTTNPAVASKKYIA